MWNRSQKQSMKDTKGHVDIKVISYQWHAGQKSEQNYR